MNISEHIKSIINEIEGDDERLYDTPKRVEAAYDEFFDGYAKRPEDVLNVVYQSEMDDLIVLKNIPFESHCEHHMVPIIGHVCVGYVPNGQIIGASKMARIVDIFAHRLQLQERFTMEIATTLYNSLGCKGVGVYVEGEHFCISRRGVKKQGVKFVTRYFTGCLKNDLQLRQEFLQDCYNA